MLGAKADEIWCFPKLYLYQTGGTDDESLADLDVSFDLSLD